MKKRFWVIQGFDGSESLYEGEFAFSRYSEKQMTELLRLLVAKEALSAREIVESIGRKSTGLLEVHRQMDGKLFMCGQGIHFAARVTER